MHVGVADVHEVLVPGVRRGHRRVEPDVPAAGRLAELAALGVGDQRRGQRVHRLAVDPADQVDPADDVAPLVGAADLQLAAVLAVQLQVVVATAAAGS